MEELNCHNELCVPYILGVQTWICTPHLTPKMGCITSFYITDQLSDQPPLV